MESSKHIRIDSLARGVTVELTRKMVNIFQEEESKEDGKHLLLECSIWKHEREILNLDWKVPLKTLLLYPSFQNSSRIVLHKLLTLEFQSG
ncbi:hypothetical protein AVEN_78781-1 [Araneus ventricosus]|uniref:Uncharacterized protein n=1 Tax=Araneus ventricosus TaxID=182803 RepID=A0A4Y2S0Y9_ARAVE|nr:hypothetical protein AVEN_78781-1 [Araneus ventricosus]